MEIVSICVSDIPKNKITVSTKNGKKYLSIVVDKRKSPDRFGNDLTVYLNQTKEEREAKADRVYVGQGKTYNFNNTESKPAAGSKKADDDDLPF